MITAEPVKERERKREKTPPPAPQKTKWAASSEFGTYQLCEQRRFSRACASAQSRQNLRCSLIQAVNQAEPSDRKPDPWPLWMTGHAQLKFVMTECSKTQIRLTRHKYPFYTYSKMYCVARHWNSCMWTSQQTSPGNQPTHKWAATWQNQQSDQSLRCPHEDSEDSDAQSDLSLRWAHAHFVGFVMPWLISVPQDWSTSPTTTVVPACTWTSCFGDLFFILLIKQNLV